MKDFLRKAFYKRRDLLVQHCNRFLNKFIVIPPDILLQAPAAKSALVIAPHPDDEVIGCGGTVHNLTKQGSKVDVLIVTGGKNVEGNNLSETRKQEARDATAILGVNRLSFLEFEEENIRPAARLEEALQAKIEDIQPAIVFAPNIFDNHPDHILIGQGLLNAAKACRFEFQCYFFEVWTPLVANTFIDITSEVETKTRALEAHQSQVNTTPLKEMILSLNRYRAIAALSGNPSMKYAEAFFRVGPQELSSLSWIQKESSS